jgi:hypothetical protein
LETEVLLEVFPTRDKLVEVSCCFAMTETALRKGRELIAIPGTSENGNRRTGREDARASEKQLRIMDFKENEANSLESTSMGVS